MQIQNLPQALAPQGLTPQGLTPMNDLLSGLSNISDIQWLKDKTMEADTFSKKPEEESDGSYSKPVDDPDMEEKETTTENLYNFVPMTEEELAEKTQLEAKNAVDAAYGKASSMDIANHYLDIAKEYEAMAQAEGASQETIDHANAVVSNIKQYVAQMVTTGDDVSQRMDAAYEKNYDQLMDAYREDDTSSPLHGVIQEFGTIHSTVENMVAESGMSNSLSDVGLEDINETYQDMSIEEMQALFSSAKEIYTAEADKLFDTYHTMFTEDEQQLEKPSLTGLNNPEALEKELGEGILKLVGVHGEGNIFATNFGEITLETEGGTSVTIPNLRGFSTLA